MTDQPNKVLISDKIEKLLRNYIENEERIHIDKLTIKAGSNVGDNYLGIIGQVHVQGINNDDGEIVERNLIVKSAPKVDGLRHFACIPLAYGREIYIYTKILPTFDQLQTDLGIENGAKFKSYAKYLTSSTDESDEALILNDMKSSGFRMEDRQKPLDYNHVKLVLEELAKLHSLSFVLKEKKPNVYEKIRSEMASNTMLEIMEKSKAHRTTVQSDRAKRTLNPETDQEAIERFEKYSEHSLEDITHILSISDEPYCVIRHGDCWTNNFLFAYQDQNKPTTPTDLCFLDYQLSCIAPPVLDIHYLIYTCTDRELRAKHLSQLLKHYYQTMHDFTNKLGCDLDKLYPKQVFEQQFREYGKYGLSIAVVIIHMLASDADEIPDINEVFKNKNLDEVKEAFQFETKNIHAYNIRMRDIILEMVEKNYI